MPGSGSYGHVACGMLSSIVEDCGSLDICMLISFTANMVIYTIPATSYRTLVFNSITFLLTSLADKLLVHCHGYLICLVVLRNSHVNKGVVIQSECAIC